MNLFVALFDVRKIFYLLFHKSIGSIPVKVSRKYLRSVFIMWVILTLVSVSIIFFQKSTGLDLLEGSWIVRLVIWLAILQTLSVFAYLTKLHKLHITAESIAICYFSIVIQEIKRRDVFLVDIFGERGKKVSVFYHERNLGCLMNMTFNEDIPGSKYVPDKDFVDKLKLNFRPELLSKNVKNFPITSAKDEIEPIIDEYQRSLFKDPMDTVKAVLLLILHPAVISVIIILQVDNILVIILLLLSTTTILNFVREYIRKLLYRTENDLDPKFYEMRSKFN